MSGNADGGPRNNPQLMVCADREALNARAAELWTSTLAQAIQRNGRASVALSGGSTPQALYELLATSAWSAKNDWRRIHFFWGDERAVLKDDPRSNYRMTRQALLQKVAAPEANVHRVLAELGAEKAASAYEETLREFFPGAAMPAIDLVLLGLGENAHTASLFPHTRLLHETKRWVVSEYIEEVKMERITLSVPAINSGRTIAFLVSGASKAEVVEQVLYGKLAVEQMPAQLIRAQAGPVLWLLDREAAARVEKRKR